MWSSCLWIIIHCKLPEPIITELQQTQERVRKRKMVSFGVRRTAQKADKTGNQQQMLEPGPLRKRNSETKFNRPSCSSHCYYTVIVHSYPNGDTDKSLTNSCANLQPTLQQVVSRLVPEAYKVVPCRWSWHAWAPWSESVFRGWWWDLIALMKATAGQDKQELPQELNSLLLKCKKKKKEC